MSTLPSQAFDRSHAEGYDQNLGHILPIKDCLHLLIRQYFSTLPEEAHILVAGAGTGAEVRFLAALYPRWHFTLVDPSEAMLSVAQRHTRNEGVDHRCHFHVGLVSSLSTGSFDAATSVLVSHFLADAADRQAYFASIADRLKPGGLFFNADLCGDRAAPSFDGLMELWLRVAGMPEDRKPFFRAAFGKALAVQGPAEVEALMAAAGFAAPAPCFQATLIRGWFTHRAPTGGSGPGPDHAGRDNRLFPPPPGDFSGK